MNGDIVAAVTFDAAGTLLHPALPVAEVYARHAARHGVTCDVPTVGPAFRAAMRGHRALRDGDPSWRRYWSAVIAASTGCTSSDLVDDLLDVYARPDAWRVADGAIACMHDLRAAGVRVGVLPNWDTRLRSLLRGLGVLDAIDVLVVSGEHGFEKPDVRIFLHAARALEVDVGELLHIGDDDDDDIAGARAAGCHALHFGEIGDFANIPARVRRR